MIVKAITNSSKSDSEEGLDDEDSDESDENMFVDQDVTVSDDNSSVDMVSQPSKKKKFN